MFGEMAVLTSTDFEARVTALGYSRLLLLLEGDLYTLLDRDSILREKVETIAKQRLRALTVWQEFESGQRQHEPLPELNSQASGNSPNQHGAMAGNDRSEEHTSELQSLMRISYAVFCLKKKKKTQPTTTTTPIQ